MGDRTIELEPVRSNSLKYKNEPYYEQVLIKQDGYPFALAHVDLLWTTPEHRELHERLCKGETIKVEMTLREIEAD